MQLRIRRPPGLDPHQLLQPPAASAGHEVDQHRPSVGARTQTRRADRISDPAQPRVFQPLVAVSQKASLHGEEQAAELAAVPLAPRVGPLQVGARPSAVLRHGLAVDAHSRDGQAARGGVRIAKAAVPELRAPCVGVRKVRAHEAAAVEGGVPQVCPRQRRAVERNAREGEQAQVCRGQVQAGQRAGVLDAHAAPLLAVGPRAGAAVPRAQPKLDNALQQVRRRTVGAGSGAGPRAQPVPQRGLVRRVVHPSVPRAADGPILIHRARSWRNPVALAGRERGTGMITPSAGRTKGTSGDGIHLVQTFHIQTHEECMRGTILRST